jgi:ABC-type multidrug transport system permease subunit
MGNLGFQEILVFIYLILPGVALIDIFPRRFKNNSVKCIMVLLILFVPVLGVVFYFRKKRAFLLKAN